MHRWEIWNEPNLAAFWRPRPTVDQYAEVYARLRAAILAADATAKVATGGVTVLRIAWGKQDIDGLTFIRRLIGHGTHLSLVAVHPYTTRCPGCRVSGTKQLR